MKIQYSLSILGVMALFPFADTMGQNFTTGGDTDTKQEAAQPAAAKPAVGRVILLGRKPAGDLRGQPLKEADFTRWKDIKPATPLTLPYKPEQPISTQ